MNFDQLISEQNRRAASGQTRSNINRVIPNILRNISNDKSYLVVGHGKHTRDYFTLPSGKYVVFFSNPGVSLSEGLIANSKFQNIIRTPFSLAQFMTGNLNRNKVPNFLRYSRTNFNWKKMLYTPQSSCPEMHLQMWDTNPPLAANGTGIYQKYMGLWRLPDLTQRYYLNQVKTLSEIVSEGPPGVYFVYACRITPGNLNWSNPTRVYTRARTVLPNLQSYNAFLGNRMNTNNLKNNYIANVRLRLQNIGRLNLVPLLTQNIKQKEEQTYRMAFKKRMRRV